MNIAFLKLLVSIAVCLLAGSLGSIFTTPAISGWYTTLNKPSFNPPNWLFAPVWTTLFILMGIALFLVWRQGVKGSGVALIFFAVQLIFNILWSFLFFKLQSPHYALLEIIALWLLIAITLLKFLKISNAAGLLLLPYLLWVSFAAFLNFSIYQLNK